MTDKHYMLHAILAAIEAGNAILEIYGSDFTVEQKADKSPLTEADKRSHEIIASRLKDSGIPLLSEEGRDIAYEERTSWNRLWLVDPLDGTKEFIKRNGEFTVNIALIDRDRPIFGVILVPVKKLLYVGMTGAGSYRFDLNQDIITENMTLDDIIKNSSPLPINDRRKGCADSAESACTVVGSRSHLTPEVETYVEELRKKYGNIKFVSAGSSLKFCLVAEGNADIYPRLGPTMEWDTAAGQAIAECAGAEVSCYSPVGPMTYNKENLLNPWFIVKWS